MARCSASFPGQVRDDSGFASFHMKVYWSPRSIPELENTSEERAREILKQASRRSRGHWPGFVGVVAGALCAGAFALLFGAVGGGAFYGIFGGGVGGVLGALLANQIMIPVVRANVREILASEEKSAKPAESRTSPGSEPGGDGAPVPRRGD